MALTEDDIYRASTQYRLWSFTPTALSAFRLTTNTTAANRALTTPPTHPTPTPLTPAEELALLTHYTSQLLATADALSLPTSIKATAAQYLKRFYLSNSPMTYHPKQLFPACLFLATKTDNHYVPLERFAEKLDGVLGGKGRVGPGDVVGCEFVLTQGLRFTFEVRQPGRGLRGGYMELVAMAEGKAGLLPGVAKDPARIQEEMLALPPASPSSSPTPPSKSSVPALLDRCAAAHATARTTLATTALLTDAYLLYTPPQIWLSALLLADSPLGHFYLGTKFPDPASPVHARLVPVLKGCVEMLREAPGLERGVLVGIDKKLYLWRAGVEGKGGKREGVVGVEDAKVKKRRIEREKGEREGDVFGGALGGGG